MKGSWVCPWALEDADALLADTLLEGINGLAEETILDALGEETLLRVDCSEQLVIDITLVKTKNNLNCFM